MRQANAVICDMKNARIIRKSAILRNKDVTAYYRYIFDECDANKDNRICVAELRDFLADNEGEIPDRVVRCLYQCFDKNGDHVLDFDEFLELINNPTVTDTFTRVGSKYLKFVAQSSVKEKSLSLKRTVTNTGLYEEEVTLRFYTVGMIVISVLQIVCFYVDQKKDNVILKTTEFDPEKKYQMWRYITYILSHSDQAHLFGNVIIQLVLGLPLEMVHTWRVPLIYICGAVGGCLANASMYPDDPLVGGSGGVYAFYSAHLATVIMNWREMSHPVVHFLIFGVLIAFDAIRNTVMPSQDTNVSYVAHLGGVVVGLLMGVVVLRNLRVTKVETLIWYLCLIILLGLTIGFTIQNFVMVAEQM